MKLSAIDRINLVGDEKASTRFLGTFGSALGSYLTTNVGEALPNDRLSFALLYLLQPDIRFCIDLYVRIMTRLTWELILNPTTDPANDKIVAKSNDVKPRHLLFEAFRRHTRRYGISPIAAIGYQYLLYDEVYVQLIRNKHGYTTDIRVLNTLAVEPVISLGRIAGYRYTGIEDPKFLPLHEIAYGHGFNPLDDLSGGSIMEAVLKSSNVLRNLMTYVDALFINNGRPGLIASFKEAITDERALRLMEKQLEIHHKGARQAFRTFISNIPLDWQPLDDPDVQRQFAVEEPVTKQIYRAFGVPMVMAGDTSATDYKESEEIYAAFVKMQVVPHTDAVAQFLNDEVVPIFGDLRINPDVSEFDMLTEGDKRRSEIVGTDLKNTLISIASAQEAMGYPVDEEMKDLYYVEGIPVPKQELRNLWRTKYGTEQSVLSAMLGGRSSHHHGSKSVDREELEIDSWSYSPSKAFKELVYWQRWTLDPESFKSTGDFFVPVYLRGDYADLITSNGQSKEAFDEVFASLKMNIDKIESAWCDTIDAVISWDADSAVRAITGVKLEFEGRFAGVLETLRTGSLDRRRAGGIFRQLLRMFGYRAYRQGLADSGVLSNPDETEEAEIEMLIKEQSPFVSGLTKTVITKGLSNDQARLKSGQWFGASILPFYHAGLESGNRNLVAEFAGDDGIESCPTCTRLKGQRHRIKDWKRKQLRPQQDGNSFDCKGHNCHHRLVPVVAGTRGSW